MSQLVKHMTLDFSSVHDFRVLRLSPALPSMEPAWGYLSPSLSVPLHL